MKVFRKKSLRQFLTPLITRCSFKHIRGLGNLANLILLLARNTRWQSHVNFIIKFIVQNKLFTSSWIRCQWFIAVKANKFVVSLTLLLTKGSCVFNNPCRFIKKKQQQQQQLFKNSEHWTRLQI